MIAVEHPVAVGPTKRYPIASAASPSPTSRRRPRPSSLPALGGQRHRQLEAASTSILSRLQSQPDFPLPLPDPAETAYTRSSSEHDSDSDDANDVFYTPNSSPVLAPITIWTDTSLSSNSSTTSSKSHYRNSQSSLSLNSYRTRSTSLTTPASSFRNRDDTDSSSRARCKIQSSTIDDRQFHHLLTSEYANDPRRTSPRRSRHASYTASPLRMTAVLEEEETGNHPLNSPKSLGSRRSQSNTLEQDSKKGPSLPKSEASRRSSMLSKREGTYQKVDIPAALPVLGRSTPGGFSQLVLPKAVYTPSSNPQKDDGLVDLISMGLSQAAMSSIEIQKNAAEKLTNKGRFSTSRLSGRWKQLSINPNDTLPIGDCLAFAAHRKPPAGVGMNEVLVQVVAVGLDSMDGLILKEKSSDLRGVGFIPGRSFFGKAIEVGFAVHGIMRGDWVYGLLDARKSGALTEFVVVDRRRVCMAPTARGDIKVEQLALLPLFGIASRRAVASFTSRLNPKGSTIFILQAHTGVGALACQELSAIGFRVIAQIPSASCNFSKNHAIVKSNGAAEVVSEEPLQSLQKLSSTTIHGVLDTIGGKEVWKAARMALHDGGQFTTVVGEDTTSAPNTNVRFKSNFRSLRRAISKHKNKLIGYAWIPSSSELDQEGEDIHDTLSSLGSLVDARVLTPDVGQVVPFERTPAEFPSPMELGVEVSKHIVVRLVG